MNKRNLVCVLLAAAVLFVCLSAGSNPATAEEKEAWKNLAQKLGDDFVEFGALAQMMKAYFELGEVATGKGDFQKAIGYFEEVLAREEKLLSYNVPDPMRKEIKMILTEVYGRVAGAYVQSGDLEKAEKFLSSILKRDDLEPQQKAKLNMHLANFYRHTKQFDKAEGALLKVIEINKRILENTPDWDSSPIKKKY
jgi:tetratricopeptide (TPR) repeat protein